MKYGESADPQTQLALRLKGVSKAAQEAATPSGLQSGGTIPQEQVTGTWTKGVNTTEAGEFDAGLQSTGVYSNALTGTARSVQVLANGTFGYVASTRTLKTEIDVADFTDEQVEKLVLVHFQYTSEAAAGSTDVHIGLYAEDLHDAGLHDFVIYRDDDDGHLVLRDGEPVPDGIRHELLALLVLPAVQRLISRTRQLRSDVDEIRKHIGLE